MEHRLAVRRLPALLAGELAGERRGELEEHLESCPQCRDWAETYGFLADALQGAGDGHPSSEQLAQLAVDPELLTSPERRQLQAHLEGCAGCRRELRLSRDALAAARPEPAVAGWPRRLPAPARLALAASLILALAAGFFALRPDGADRGPAVAAAPEAAPRAGGSAGDQRLTDARLEGRQLIEAPGVISAGATAIGNGSDITLRAGEMVVLGDGFSIGSAANLGVEIGPTRAPSKAQTPS